jgi:hypothetical protein
METPMKRLRPILAMLAVGLAASLLVPPASAAPSARPAWVERDPETHPFAQGYFTMAYDVARERTVLLTGNCLCVSQTWAWDGETWTEFDLAVQPPSRRSASMAYDEARGEVVVFGGLDPNDDPLTDTWVFDGTAWSQRTPASSPPGAYLTPMAYDPVRAETVLFRRGQTWVWNGTTWKQRTPEHSPPAVQGFGLAFDESRDRVILYGGRSSTEKHHKHTWLWNGHDWRKLRAVGSAGKNFDGALTAFDGRVMLFGGEQDGSAINQTWLLGAKRWKRLDLDPHPRSRVGHALVWDSKRQEAVLFGGTHDGFLGDTWALEP